MGKIFSIRNIIIFTISIIVVVIITIFLKENDYDIFPGSENGKVEYTYSDTVYLSMEKIRTLNPITSKDEGTYQLSSLIFDSLFVFDNNLSLQNSLAKDYEYNSKDNSVTINIKDNEYFSDGTKLTGKDVKFSIENYMAAAAAGNSLYGNYVGNIKSVQLGKDDDYSITIKFKSGNDISMDNFVFPILSEKCFGNKKAYSLIAGNFIPVGSGPYAIESYNDISDLTLVPNKHYSGEKPKNTIYFTLLPETDDMIPLLEVGSITMGVMDSLVSEPLIADKNIHSYKFLSNEAEVIGFNFAKEAMKNVKIRKAIAYCTDVKDLNEGAYYKSGVYTDSIYYPGYLGTENKGDQYTYDLNTAKELINSAKYYDRDENGILEDSKGNELNIRILVNSKEANRVVVAENIKEQLDKLKISGEIVYAVDNADFQAKLAGKDYDFFIAGIRFNETYDLRPLLHTNYNNAIGYSNPKLDALLDKLKTNVSKEKKKETVVEIKELLNKELPYYCIIYKTKAALKSDSINGEKDIYMFNNYYIDSAHWNTKYRKSEENIKIDSNRNIDSNQ